MLKKTQSLLALILVSFLLGSCAKNGMDYVYINKNNRISQAKTVKVKEFSGVDGVDIVWLIDNSGSMYSYQAQVISNANLFMQAFVKESLDWKMGLISTDTYDAPYVGFSNGPALDSTLPNGLNIFTNAVGKLGTNGDSTEKTFATLLKALQNDSHFLRPNKALAYIMVTDAEEQSGYDAQDFINQLKPLIGDRPVYTYGAFAAQDFGCKSDESAWNFAGSPYEGFMNWSKKGTTYPLCRDFGTTLANIGVDIAKQVTHGRIYLDQRPVLSTLRVVYNGIELKAGLASDGGVWVYDYDRNAIIFNSLDFALNMNDSVNVLFDQEH